MSAPERIWVHPRMQGYDNPVETQRPDYDDDFIEYTRADLCPTPPAIDPKVTALVEAAKELAAVVSIAFPALGKSELVMNVNSALAAWEAQ